MLYKRSIIKEIIDHFKEEKMESFNCRLEFKSLIKKNEEILKIKIFGDFKHIEQNNCVNHHDPINLFNHEIDVLIERSKNEHSKLIVIVDMKKCHYISSSGLASLVSTYKSISHHCGQFRIINIIDPIMSLFEETKIAEVIDCQSLKKIVKKPLV